MGYAVAATVRVPEAVVNAGVEADGTGALFTLPAMGANVTARRCMRLTARQVDSTLRLYGQTTGTGFADHLRLTVERGQVPPGPYGSCAGFVADVDPVVFDGTLEQFPDGAQQATQDAAPFPRDTARAYRFSITSDDDPARAGKWARQDFTVCARPIGTASTDCSPLPAQVFREVSVDDPRPCDAVDVAATGDRWQRKRILKWRRLAPQPAAAGAPILKARMVVYVLGPIGKRRLVTRLAVRYGHGIRKRYRIQSVQYLVNGKRIGSRQRTYPYRIRVPNSALKAGKNNIRARVVISGRGVKPRTLYWGFRLAAVKQADGTGLCSIG